MTEQQDKNARARGRMRNRIVYHHCADEQTEEYNLMRECMDEACNMLDTTNYKKVYRVMRWLYENAYMNAVDDMLKEVDNEAINAKN